MNRLLYAAVADDDTGASDLAGMFADQDVRVVLVLDVPSAAELEQWTKSATGLVFATATRALPPEQAYKRTMAAVTAASALCPRTVQIKYCSTFDSTERGNIGPSIDAAMDALGERFTIALPALPVNGRTTYSGYHFVKGQLLSGLADAQPSSHADDESQSGEPARDADQRRVGLIPYLSSIRHRRDPAVTGCELREFRYREFDLRLPSDRHAADLCEAPAI